MVRHRRVQRSGRPQDTSPIQIALDLWLGHGNDQATDPAWMTQHGITHVIHSGEDGDKPRGRSIVKGDQELVVSILPKQTCIEYEDLEDVLEFVEEARDAWDEFPFPHTFTSMKEPRRPCFLIAGPVVRSLLVAGTLLKMDDVWRCAGPSSVTQLSNVFGHKVVCAAERVTVKRR